MVEKLELADKWIQDGHRPGICYRVDGAIVSDEQGKEWLCELIESEGYSYGYLKLTVCLRRKYGLVINKKKVYRLCKELQLLRPQRKIRRKYQRDWQGT